MLTIPSCDSLAFPRSHPHSARSITWHNVAADHGDCVKTYRCKHAVEAMQWIDTDENREAFAAWFESHDAVFETRGATIVLPEEGTANEGE